MSSNTFRTILRATSIIGGASVINILVGLIRIKIVAVLLGPAGVGLVGLYYNLMQTAGGIAGFGLGNSGTRQVAAGASGGAATLGRVRRALFWGTLVQALVGATLFWLASGWIATWVVGDPARTAEVGWLALGVWLTVAGSAQGALLTGLRRLGDIARVQVGSGILGTMLSVGALWLWGSEWLIAMVLITPVVGFALGQFYVSRLERPAPPPDPARILLSEWSAMARLGLAFMVSGLVVTLGLLATRVLIQRELGTEALGQFQAAWAIGMTYLGVVLGSMGTDYYPRLTAAMSDPNAATRLVNEQTEVALLLCGPVLVAMLGCAPWVVQLLYTAEFGPTVEILRWQLLGDILKVMSWPLAFVLIAAPAGKTYVMVETIGIGVFVLGVFIGMPLIGVTATGVAFLALYVAYLPLVLWLGGRQIGFRWTRAVRWQAGMVLGAALAVQLVARSSDMLGTVAGLGLGTGLGVWSLLRLSAASNATGRLAPLARTGERIRVWMTAT